MTASSKSKVPDQTRAAGHLADDGGAMRSNACFLTIAVVLAVIGLVMLLAGFNDELLENERLLRQPDAALGISTKTVLLLGGMLQIVLGGVLLLSHDRLTRVLLVLWAVSVCAVYRLGMGWLQRDNSCPVVKLTAHQAGMSPGVFGVVWGLLLGGMVAGAFWQWETERRRRKREKEVFFLEQWRESREKAEKTLPPNPI